METTPIRSLWGSEGPAKLCGQPHQPYTLTAQECLQF